MTEQENTIEIENDAFFARLAHQGMIAADQLKMLNPSQKAAVYQLIGKLYQQNLEGEEEDPNRVSVTFRHSVETNEVFYQLSCRLDRNRATRSRAATSDRAKPLLHEAQNLCAGLEEQYLGGDR